jgi:hypothetical protein
MPDNLPAGEYLKIEDANNNDDEYIEASEDK